MEGGLKKLSRNTSNSCSLSPMNLCLHPWKLTLSGTPINFLEYTICSYSLYLLGCILLTIRARSSDDCSKLFGRIVGHDSGGDGLEVDTPTRGEGTKCTREIYVSFRGLQSPQDTLIKRYLELVDTASISDEHKAILRNKGRVRSYKETTEIKTDPKSTVIIGYPSTTSVEAAIDKFIGSGNTREDEEVKLIGQM